MIRTKWRIVGLAAALSVGWGCGGSAPAVDSATEEATIQGTVTAKGKPVTQGRITFDPSNIKRQVGPRTAPIEKDGTYTIKTLTGKNSVIVEGPTIAKDPNLAMNQTTVDVESGENRVPIELAPTTP